VIYIYPYAKSKASDLHSDSIQTTGLSHLDESKLRFLPFLGIAPRRYQTAFAMTTRKNKTGKVNKAIDHQRSPRIPDNGIDGRWDVAAHIDREKKAIVDIDQWLPIVTEELRKTYQLKEDGSGVA
jgi:hypothetical protein